jgi:hypothetical protein
VTLAPNDICLLCSLYGEGEMLSVTPAGYLFLDPGIKGEIGIRAEDSPLVEVIMSDTGTFEPDWSDRRKFWLLLGVEKAGPLPLAESVDSMGLLRFLNAGVADDGCNPDSKKSSNLGVE